MDMTLGMTIKTELVLKAELEQEEMLAVKVAPELELLKMAAWWKIRTISNKIAIVFTKKAYQKCPSNVPTKVEATR